VPHSAASFLPPPARKSPAVHFFRRLHPAGCALRNSSMFAALGARNDGPAARRLGSPPRARTWLTALGVPSAALAGTGQALGVSKHYRRRRREARSVQTSVPVSRSRPQCGRSAPSSLSLCAPATRPGSEVDAGSRRPAGRSVGGSAGELAFPRSRARRADPYHAQARLRRDPGNFAILVQ